MNLVIKMHLYRSQLIQGFEDIQNTALESGALGSCGVAQRDTLHQAYLDALAGDPVSAFGGVLISNSEIDLATAEEIHNLFCVVYFMCLFYCFLAVKCYIHLIIFLGITITASKH